MEAMMEELSEMGNNPNTSDLSQWILSLENRLKTILNKHHSPHEKSLQELRILGSQKRYMIIRKLYEGERKSTENTKLLKHIKHMKQLINHTRLSYNKPNYKHYPSVSTIVPMTPRNYTNWSTAYLEHQKIILYLMKMTKKN